MLLAAATSATPDSTRRAERRLDRRAFASHDQTSIFYRHWATVGGERQGGVIILHRQGEHSGRIQHLVDELGLDGFDFFAWDARGHGCSPGARGDAPGAACLVKDLDAFVRHIEAVHAMPAHRIHVLGLGAGAVLAAAWAHDYAPRIASMALAAPAFECRGLAQRAPNVLRTLYRRRGNVTLRTHAEGQDLTTDLARIAAYEADPLIVPTTSARVVIGMQDASRRVLAGAGSIRIPTLVLVAGRDRLVRTEPQADFFHALGTPDKEMHVFTALRHDVLGELERMPVLERVSGFIRQRTAPSSPHTSGADEPSMAHAGRRPFAVPRLPAVRASLRSVNRLSNGLRLAMDTGLHSDELLDYVCRHRESGTGALGRILDRRFLASPVAGSLRARNQHLQRALVHAAARITATGLPLRIVDIAAGSGLHVLEALIAMHGYPESVLLHDLNRDAVDRGLRRIQERRLDGLVRHRHVARVNSDWIASLAQQTTVAVAALHDGSALDRTSMQDVLAGLSRAVPPGGCLVYASGPHHTAWHRATSLLRTTDAPMDAPVVIQADVERCVLAAGFRPVDRWVDEWGIFAVTLCVREGTENALDRLIKP